MHYLSSVYFINQPQAEWRNKLRINSASRWFSLHGCTKMHDQENVRGENVLVIYCVKIIIWEVKREEFFSGRMLYVVQRAAMMFFSKWNMKISRLSFHSILYHLTLYHLLYIQLLPYGNTQNKYALVKENMKFLSYVILTCEIIVEVSKNVKNKDRLSTESRGKCWKSAKVL
jgi:hypothetical protein